MHRRAGRGSRSPERVKPVLVNLHRGRIEEATITAIIQFSSVKKLQVDFGKDMTALIDTWQVVD
jgi:molybdopterin-binding protein